nr:hypothetical protein [Paracoccus aminovorans]
MRLRLALALLLTAPPVAATVWQPADDAALASALQRAGRATKSCWGPGAGAAP